MININMFFYIMSEKYWFKETFKTIFLFFPIKLIPYFLSQIHFKHPADANSYNLNIWKNPKDRIRHLSKLKNIKTTCRHLNKNCQIQKKTCHFLPKWFF